MKAPWLRIHLSAAIAMMLTLGTAISRQLLPVYESDSAWHYGWPFISRYHPTCCGVVFDKLCWDYAISFALVVAVGVVMEWAIRQRFVKRERRSWQIRLSTALLLMMVASALSASMCSIEKLSQAQPVRNSGYVMTFGMPMPTYEEFAENGVALTKVPVTGFYINVVINSIFWFGMTFSFYFVVSYACRFVVRLSIPSHSTGES